MTGITRYKCFTARTGALRHLRRLPRRLLDCYRWRIEWSKNGIKCLTLNAMAWWLLATSPIRSITGTDERGSCHDACLILDFSC